MPTTPDTTTVWCSYVNGKYLGTGDDARQIDVDARTAEKVLGGDIDHAIVLDHRTGERGVLTRASCGLGCRCAASFMPIVVTVVSEQVRAAEAALRALDPDESNWPTGEQVEAIIAAVTQ